MNDVTCDECGGGFSPHSSRQRFCSDRCRYASKDRGRMIPCIRCGALKHSNAAGRKRGYVENCHACIKETGAWCATEGGHGVNGYNKRGCRCGVCRTANTAYMRQWARKNNYWSRADVVERRKERRSTPDARAAEKRRWERYYRENREQLAVATKVKEVRRKGAPTIPFTAEQLADRLSMFAGCWMCGCERDETFHVDHVKPLSKGRWHCLSNLRPACGPCNLSKGAKWPLSELETLRASSQG